MQNNPSYRNVLIDIYDYFEEKIKRLEQKGLKKNKLFLIPELDLEKTLSII